MEFFNEEHYRKVRRVRKERGLYVFSKEYITDSPLIGQKIIRVSNGKEYNIQEVIRYWYQGYYIGLLVENNRSHALLFWQNENCYSDVMLKMIDETRSEYVLKQ